MREILYIRILMAIDTGGVFMHRACESIKIHMEGNCPASSLSCQIWIGMASLTIFIRLREAMNRDEANQEEYNEQNSTDNHRLIFDDISSE